jgi:hypothetical protein
VRVFNQGKVLSPGDLGLNVRDANGQLIDPAAISYSIFSQAPDDTLRLVSPPKFLPNRSSTGVYHVGGHIPSDFDGHYRLIWYLQQYPDNPEVQLFEEFDVIRLDPATTSFEAPSVLVVPRPALNKVLAECIIKVRELLSDEDPERNYHFRPPTTGRIVAGFNDRVGFIWTDRTIIRMLRLAIEMANTWNPMNLTDYRVENAPRAWQEAIAVGAAAKCLSKEAARWEADEFDYSLNGVSLSLHKASEYQALAGDYASEFKEWLPNLTANRPCVQGVRQNRWLLG